MKTAILDADGTIINLIELKDGAEWSPPGGCSTVVGDYEIGGLLQAGVYTPPAPPSAESPGALAPSSISDRQFFQELAVSGIITQAEALAAVKTGDVPAALAAIVSAMPDDQQFAAQMILSGATVFERTHPMTETIGTAYGWTGDQVDDFFRAAALL
jgi:hypothetical protein